MDLFGRQSQLAQARRARDLQVGLVRAGEQAVLTFGLQQRGAVEISQRLALLHLRADKAHMKRLDPPGEIGRQDAMPRVVVVNGPRDEQRFGERTQLRFRSLHIEHPDGRWRKRQGIAGQVETGLAFINRREFHAADRTASGIIRLDPRMHCALVVQNFAFLPTPGGAGRFRLAAAAEAASH